jgi:hypothetical protein
MNKITVYEGNTIPITLTVTDPDGVAVDMEDYTITITVKAAKDDSEVLIEQEAALIETNVVTITIDADDNTLEDGTYYYEVTAELGDEKYTLVQDRFVVRESMLYVT